MERLLAARKMLDEALEEERAITREMFVISEQEKPALLELAKAAKMNRIVAEANLTEARKAYLSSAAPKREEKHMKRSWIDANGKEHTLEYVMV